jgi:acid phosphatase
MRSSNPSLGNKDGNADLIDLDVFLGYVDGLVGKRADKVVGNCAL